MYLETLQETYKLLIQVFEQYLARQGTLSGNSGLHHQSHRSQGSEKEK